MLFQTPFFQLVDQAFAGPRVPEVRRPHLHRRRSRQKLHRTIDITLISLATVSAVVFVFAFAVVHHFSPPHTFWFEIGSLGGFALSALVWLIVAVSTPAPLVVKDAALTGAQKLTDRLPENLRDRIPEELRVRISGHS